MASRNLLNKEDFMNIEEKAIFETALNYYNQYETPIEMPPYNTLINNATDLDRQNMVKIFTYYYEHYVWRDSTPPTPNASDLDYAIRNVRNRFNLKFGNEICQRW